MSYRIRTKLGVLVTATVLCVFSSVTRADVITPALDISTVFGGTGVSNVGGSLTIDATAFSIFLEGTPLPPPIDIPDVPFSLTATYSGSVGNQHTFINGSLSAGPYMFADVGPMTLVNLGGGIGQLLEAPLTYTGGTLVAGSSGSIAGSIFGASSDDFSVDFTAPDFLAKAGPVVPIPAAVWLFGSGLLGLVAVARRKKVEA